MDKQTSDEQRFLIDLIFKPVEPGLKLRPAETQLLLSYIGEILKEVEEEETNPLTICVEESLYGEIFNCTFADIFCVRSLQIFQQKKKNHKTAKAWHLGFFKWRICFRYCG